MRIFVDGQFHVHTEAAEGTSPIDTDVFEGMPEPVVCCYRFVPEGKTCQKPNGDTVYGPFVQPFVTEKELERVWRDYERKLIAQYEALINQLYEEVQ